MNVKKIILASGSSSRRAMLKAADIAFAVVSPGVDETAMTRALLAKGMDAAAVASALAEAKALSVAAGHKDAIVIGSDQVLVCRGALIAKSSTRAEARMTLQGMRGTHHALISAAVLVEGGNVIWRGKDSATLHMREFSDAFLDSYLDAEIPDIFGSVGCYRIEGRGAQLFERIEGDQFCIRGLPLLAVLAALREHGALQT